MTTKLQYNVNKNGGKEGCHQARDEERPEKVTGKNGTTR